jgi:hypothetical protein
MKLQKKKFNDQMKKIIAQWVHSKMYLGVQNKNLQYFYHTFLVFSIIIKSLNLSSILQWKIIYTSVHKQACKQIERKIILFFLGFF